MNLKELKVLPGQVIDINDPKHIGRVKADVPTLFDSSKMNPDGFPWIYLFPGTSYQSFSTLRKDSKIWVFTDGFEFWYLPMVEIKEDTQAIFTNNEDDYEDADVLVSRANNENSVYIYSIRSEGIVMKLGENKLINISPEGIITIKNKDQQIILKEDQINIGSGESKEPAVLGLKLVELISKLENALSGLSAAANSSPYTAALVPAINQCKSALSGKDDIKAKNTFVD